VRRRGIATNIRHSQVLSSTIIIYLGSAFFLYMAAIGISAILLGLDKAAEIATLPNFLVWLTIN
jgi:hypothetical protein